MMFWLYYGVFCILVGIASLTLGIRDELKHRPYIPDGRRIVCIPKDEHVLTFNDTTKHTLYTLKDFVDEDGNKIKGKVLTVVLNEDKKEGEPQ